MEEFGEYLFISRNVEENLYVFWKVFIRNRGYCCWEIQHAIKSNLTTLSILDLDDEVETPTIPPVPTWLFKHDV